MGRSKAQTLPHEIISNQVLCSIDGSDSFQWYLKIGNLRKVYMITFFSCFFDRDGVLITILIRIRGVGGMFFITYK